MTTIQQGNIELCAWIGEDDGSEDTGRIGLKQAIVPAGLVPLVAMDYHKDKLQALRGQMEDLSSLTGKKRYLCRFVMVEIIEQTDAGEGIALRAGAH